MTTPDDPPKPARWRRHQLEMRLRQGAPPGPERRGASRAPAGPAPRGGSAPAAARRERSAKGRKGD